MRDVEWLLEEKYGGKPDVQFDADRARIEAGEPLDYVIGWKRFLSTKIDLSHRPLIPRVETEFQVECLLEEARERGLPIRVLDLFAGSGCVGVGFLHELETAQVDFAEIDPRLVEQIQENCALNEIAPERFRVFQSDVFDGVPTGREYDLIFANPPYLSETRRDSIQASVIAHEPSLALFAGTDGLALIEKTLLSALERLAPEGELVIEMDPWQIERAGEIAKEAGFSRVQFQSDQFGESRFGRFAK